MLAPDGMLLVVIPGADDLIELRQALLGERIERDRVDRTAATFASLFTLQRHERIAHTVMLDRQSMLDVMSSSYRGLRARERTTLETLDAMNVTLSRDLLVFKPR